MMLQDRSGRTTQFLAQNVGKFVAEARKRPELAGVRPNFSPARAAALRRTSTRRRRSSRASPSPTSTTRCRRSSAARTSTTSRASGASGGSSCRPSRSSARSPTTSATSTCATARARWSRSRRSCNVHADERPRVHRALQPVPLGRDPRRRSAGLQLGAGARGARGRRGEDAPARDGLRVERALVPGEGGVRRVGASPRPVARRSCSSSWPRSTRAGRCRSACF